jgi:hypothetical protein
MQQGTPRVLSRDHTTHTAHEESPAAVLHYMAQYLWVPCRWSGGSMQGMPCIMPWRQGCPALPWWQGAPCRLERYGAVCSRARRSSRSRQGRSSRGRDGGSIPSVEHRMVPIRAIHIPKDWHRGLAAVWHIDVCAYGRVCWGDPYGGRPMERYGPPASSATEELSRLHMLDLFRLRC